MQNPDATIIRQLNAQSPVVLVTVTAQHGSAPRGAGARMLVLANGDFTGTVGGGAHEAEALAAAAFLHKRGNAASAEAIANTAPPQGAFLGLTLSFNLQGVSDMDMVCGGSLDLLLEYIPAESDCPGSLFAPAAQAEREGRSYVLAALIREHDTKPLPGTQTHYTEVSSFRAFFDASGLHSGCPEVLQALPQDIVLQALQSKQATPFCHKAQNESGLFLVEPFPAPPRLCIFGAGHVSKALAALALEVGFSVTVADDRAEFANAARFPGAQVCVLPSLSEHDAQNFLASLAPGPDDALAVITRGHACDREALAAALGTKAGYIGMIGSSSKRKAVYKTLEEQGITSEQLAKVHSPIGLSIGADTPAEIAVSIVAELIAWRRGKAPLR